MKTAVGLAVVGSFAIAVLILQLSGIAGILGIGGTSQYTVDDNFEQQADKNKSQLKASGGNAGQGQSTVLSFVTGAISTVFDFAVGAFLMPVTFKNAGLPWYGAYPLGLGVQALVLFGGAQFASNRDWI